MQPFIANQSCDIYRFGNDPPAQPPDVANVPIFLVANYERHMESGEGDAMTTRFSHHALMPYGTDVRDGYSYGVPGNGDSIRFPAGVGVAATKFNVIFVETKAKGTPQEHLKVYLDRQTPPWPSTYT
jgi:hypothetical protein